MRAKVVRVFCGLLMGYREKGWNGHKFVRGWSGADE